ncbi:guanine deaminase [Aestuariivirga litoralis]|uniref:guanine deaminase n=1 Tax=Aestuariivirga litoralis TaxID=2650924 RepID=UPI0018C665F1|nr:guanine deaminase [Aestuariivirga litoralis]MBG1232623.1 guanine deaminase [Aestuariivirga litoralis]
MTKLLIGQLVHFGAEPHQVVHEERGGLVAGDDGTILWRGPLALLPEAFSHIERDDHGKKLLMSGFIDAHIHFPQYRMLAAAAVDLLDWLSRYTFPEEARYADRVYADTAAEIFLQRLFSNGTTSALAFCSSHKVCAEALFAAAAKRNMALITGKTMMDRGAIPAVEDDPEQSAIDTLALHKAFHSKGRLRHAVTPRFAITSSDKQLKLAGEVLQDCPGALMQTHLSESLGEIARVKELFPNDHDYLGVYERFGLLTDRSLFAHGIHLSESEANRLSEAGGTVVHCPTSNTFLGSGLMSMDHLRSVSLGLATDVGGGTSYSMLQTLGETYKVQMLCGLKLKATELFHMATLGNARRLKIELETGSLDVGKFADVIVLDPEATPVLAARHPLSQSLEDVLFSLALLGDDRAISATYVAGQRVH